MKDQQALELITITLEGQLDFNIGEIVEYTRKDLDNQEERELDNLLENYYVSRRALEIWEEMKREK